jgi:hypothetical protein
VRSQLDLTSLVTQPTSSNGAPVGLLRHAGYLDCRDRRYEYGTEIEWRLEFTSADEFNLFYRAVGESTWHADGSGSRQADFVSESGAVYVLRDWWDAGLTTEADQTVTFRTRPSPNMIEMPVLFWDQTGALAYTNNVVNSLVDGDWLFVAHVRGPTVSQDWFNDYVHAAAGLVGFTNVLSCEERTYHNGAGSIHCGTNVLREIPACPWWRSL